MMMQPTGLGTPPSALIAVTRSFDAFTGTAG